MELGTSLNLFSRRRGQIAATSYLEQVTLCAEAGFRVLDLHCCDAVRPEREDDLASDEWEKRIDEVGEEAAKRGLTFSQSHAPFNAKLYCYGKQPSEEYLAYYHEMTRRAIIASGRLGVKWMVVHALNDNIHTEYDPEVIKKTNLEHFSWQVELAKKCGVGIAIENMADFDMTNFKRFYLVSPDEQIDLVDSFGDESVGACWDFGHARMVLNDQPRALRKLGKRLKATHVQDNNGTCDRHLIPFVGGNIPWETIMPVLKEIGYTGDFVFETHSFMNDLPDALRLSAGKLAYEFGAYCMDLYHQA